MDARTFADAFTRAAQEVHEEVKSSLPPEARGALDLSSIGGSFCDIWPNVEKEINASSWIVKMFAPNLLKWAKVLERVVDEVVVPEICGAAKTAAPAPKTNFNQKTP